MMIKCQPERIIVVFKNRPLACRLELDFESEICEDGIRREPLFDVDAGIDSGAVAMSACVLASEPRPRRYSMNVGITQFCLYLFIT